MAGTIVADNIRADSTSTLVLRNGVANTPPTIQDTNGTQVGTFCRAWANFDGTLSTPITPRAGFNVGSITKSATGIYQVNFTNNMPDANYSVSAIGSRGTTSTTNNVSTQVVDGTLSVSSFQVFNERSNDGAQVDANMCVAVFR
jgi:hypothetical protein